jgi:hypothetical protein
MVKINTTSIKHALFRPKNCDLIRPFKKNAKTAIKQTKIKLFNKQIAQYNYTDYRDIVTHFEIDETESEVLSNDPFMGAQNQDYYLNPMDVDVNEIDINMELDNLFLEDPFFVAIDLDLILAIMDNNFAPAG